MTGVVTAQLFRLQHAPKPDPHFGYFRLGIPIAAAFNAGAIVVVLLGAIRFWRQQHALVRGFVIAGGWEIYTIMAGSVLLVGALFATTVGVNVTKEL